MADLYVGQEVLKVGHVAGPGPQGRPARLRVTEIAGTRETGRAVSCGLGTLVTCEVIEQGDSPFYAGLSGLILPAKTLMPAEDARPKGKGAQGVGDARQ